MAGDDPFGDDDVSEAEQEELKKLMESDDVPPPDSSDEPQVDAPEPEAKPEAEDEPAPELKPKASEPASEDEPAGNQDQDGELAEFLEKHKGKSQEELAKLAFNQSKRAARSEYNQRDAAAQLKAVTDRIQAARDKKLEAIAKKREEFAKKVETDPDQALLDARKDQLDQEEAEARKQADLDQFNADAEAGVALASSIIPDFAKRAPEIADFGVSMGFSDQEIAGVTDGRQILVLHMASLAGRLIQGGAMDITGKMLAMPKPAEETDKTETKPGFGKQPARGAQVPTSTADKLAEIANMSDADFDKIADDDELMALLAEAEGS